MKKKLKLISTERGIQSFLGEAPLIAASIRITNACNFRCPHCYTEGGLVTKNELNTKEVKSMIDQLAELKTLYIFFTGGEPFLRKDIVDILKHTSDKKIKISISTNAQLINQQVLKKLKNLNFNLFQISIEGTKKVHNKIVGKEAWEKSIKTIVLAKSILKENIGVGTVMMKENWNILDKVILEASRQGADIFSLMLLIVTGRAEDSMMPAPKEILEGLQQLFNQYRKLQTKIKFAQNTTILPALVPKEWRKKELHKTFAPCSFPYCIGVSANGDVAPCDGLFNYPELIVGNVKEKTLSEIWNKSKVLKEIRKINPTDLKGVCRKCIYKDYCGGGCRAYAYIKYRDFTMPDPICQTIYEAGLFPKDCLK